MRRMKDMHGLSPTISVYQSTEFVPQSMYPESVGESRSVDRGCKKSGSKAPSGIVILRGRVQGCTGILNFIYGHSVMRHNTIGHPE